MNKDRVEILVEEKSMELFLENLLPKILPERYVLYVNCFIRPHEGKSHLSKSIPKKSRAYKHFNTPVKLIVVHDQDSNDCKNLKRKIEESVRANNEQIPLLIRIPCKELENWYLGDLKAIEGLYPKSRAERYINKAKFRIVDKLNGTEEMERLSKEFTKTFCAKNICAHMDIDSNSSTSFNQFVSGVRKFLV